MNGAFPINSTATGLRIKMFEVVCSFPSPDETAHWQAELAIALAGVAHVSDGAPSGPTKAEIAVVWRPAQAFFDANPQLKTVFVAGAGVDAVLKLKLPPTAQLVRLEDAGMGEQMADYVSYGLLQFFRRFDVYQRQAAATEGRKWRALPTPHKADWPVGVLGFGVLAQPVVQRVAELGFPVQAWARAPRATGAATVRVYAGLEQLDEFLAATRVLVCLLPLTPETRHLINAQRLAQLKPQAYFINVARGGHVVEADLIAALDSGQLAGALLDVCETEPAPNDHPFWDHPKIELTPHIAADTLMADAIEQIAQKVKRLSRGQAISGVVTQLGY
jgi:glyoxylate/hydroxypyruvate reductase